MIITIGGLKGGSGKSTVATNLAVEYLSRGKKVLLVDTDPQGTSQTWGSVGTEAGYTMPVIVAMGEGLHKPDQLPRLAESFDVVIIDCPPRHDMIQRSALAISDLVILPCSPSPSDVWALAETTDLVKKVQTLRPELVSAFLINRKQSRAVIGGEVREALGEMDLPLFDSELGNRVDYPSAMGRGLGVATYKPGPASVEVKMLVDEIETRMGCEA